jgi:hypothetical protein
MSATITVDDVGTVLRYTIKDQDGVVVDLTAATTKEIILLSPAGKRTVKTASLTNAPGTDGKIQYITIAGDLAVAGTWKRQAKVVLLSGTFYTPVTTFEVAGNIK